MIRFPNPIRQDQCESGDVSAMVQLQRRQSPGTLFFAYLGWLVPSGPKENGSKGDYDGTDCNAGGDGDYDSVDG